MTHWRSTGLALIPTIALTVAVPFVNRLDPSIFGLPFLMFWIVAWIAMAPVFLWMVGRVERRW
jgi:hypothetical protein